MNFEDQNPMNDFVRPPKQRRVNRWTKRNIIHAALTAIGVFFVGIYVLAQIDSKLSSWLAIERFTSSGGGSVETHVTQKEEELPAVTPAFDGWSQERIHAYEKASELQKSVPTALLEIASVKLEAPVLEGTDGLTLNHAVGHIAGTALPGELGNIGIAGHRDGFFRRLKDIRTGDEIALRTRSGSDLYTVDHIEIVSPREVRVLKADGNSTLTLVTCYPFYFIGGAPKRFVVKANLTQHIPAEAPSTQSRLNYQPINLSKEDLVLFGRNKSRFMALHAVSAVVFTLAAAGAHAQDTTTTTVRHGEPSYETKVKNAQVVYVEGNDLVLKLENGKVEHMVVPASEKFTIDGRDLTVSQLKTGTKLTQTITTTTTPRYVNTVRVIKGKVFHVSAPRSVILTMPEGGNQVFNLPKDAKFTVGGKPATAFDLRKGMKIEATVVTDEPQTLVASNKATVGQAPAPSTPPMVGLLLFPRYEPVVAQEASNVTAEHVDPLPASLPDTGSELPLIGLLGALGIASSFGLYLTRKRATISA